MNLYRLGRIIAKKRKENNLTQEELAEKLNISSKTVSKWENGWNAPDILLIPKLALILNSSTEELLTGNSSIKYSKFKKLFIISNVIYILIIIFIVVFAKIILDNHEYKHYRLYLEENSKYEIDGFILLNKYDYFLSIKSIQNLNNPTKLLFYNNDDLIYNCELENDNSVDNCLSNLYVKNNLFDSNNPNFSIVVKEKDENNFINSYTINLRY